IFPGRAGKDVTTENAQRATKAALVNCLAAVKWILGTLDKVKKIVRLNGQICSAIDYHDQAKIMNAASDMLVEIFGEEIGSHTRVTVGCLELPMKAVVELDLIVEFK
ncbi:MAG: endoribonuclease L-PSP, partial [uncultured bacterium]